MKRTLIKNPKNIYVDVYDDAISGKVTFSACFFYDEKEVDGHELLRTHSLLELNKLINSFGFNLNDVSFQYGYQDLYLYDSDGNSIDTGTGSQYHFKSNGDLSIQTGVDNIEYFFKGQYSIDSTDFGTFKDVNSNPE